MLRKDTLAHERVRGYIDGAGAKSPVGFGNLKQIHRRTSAPRPAGAFFVPAVRVMAGCAGRPSGLPVPCDIGLPTPHNPSPVFWQELLTVSRNQRSRNHAHNHHHPHQLKRWTPALTHTSEQPALLLARVIYRKEPKPTHPGSQPYRGRAHLQSLLSQHPGRSQWPLCDLNAANQLFEVTL